jgi:hypothetical protein
LGAEVVAEHRAEDEVLLGRQLVQWARHDEPDGISSL